MVIVSWIHHAMHTRIGVLLCLGSWTIEKMKGGCIVGREKMTAKQVTARSR